MKPTIGLLMILFLMGSECFAQQPTEKETFEELAKRLGEVQRALRGPRPVAAYPARAAKRAQRREEETEDSMPGGVETAIKNVQSIVQYLQGNPYVQLKGFKVKIGFPPGLDVDFEVPQQSAGR